MRTGVGLFFGPLHNILPFLLLGIGIVDMFVIVQTFDSLTPDQQVEMLSDIFLKPTFYSNANSYIFDRLLLKTFLNHGRIYFIFPIFCLLSKFDDKFKRHTVESINQICKSIEF